MDCSTSTTWASSEYCSVSSGPGGNNQNPGNPPNPNPGGGTGGGGGGTGGNGSGNFNPCTVEADCSWDNGVQKIQVESEDPNLSDAKKNERRCRVQYPPLQRFCMGILEKYKVPGAANQYNMPDKPIEVNYEGTTITCDPPPADVNGNRAGFPMTTTSPERCAEGGTADRVGNDANALCTIRCKQSNRGISRPITGQLVAV